MGLISRVKTWVAEVLEPADLNAEFDNILNEINGSIDTANIATGAVTSDKLAANAVTTVKILDTAVTRDKLNDDVTGAGTTRDGSGSIITDPDDATIENFGVNFRIKDAGVNEDKLHTSVAGGGLTGGGGAVLAVGGGAGITTNANDIEVNVDDSTIEINVDTLRVKAGGIDTNELANDAVDSTKLSDASAFTMAQLTLTGKLIGEPVAFSVHKNGSSQSIANNTWTTITWGTEVFDTNSDFTSNTFTPQVAGKYLMHVKVAMANLADGDGFQIQLREDSTTVASASFRSSAAADSPETSITFIVDANGSSNAYTVRVFQVTGASKSVVGTSFITYFTGHLIALSST